jgi:plastocyanin
MRALSDAKYFQIRYLFCPVALLQLITAKSVELAMRHVLSVPILLLAASVAGASFRASAAESAIRGFVRIDARRQPNVVVWVDAGSRGAERAARPVLDQRNLDFAPHVLAVQVGTAVDFPNHDRVFHNVFSFHDGKRFDLGVYPTNTSKQVTFDKPGLSRLFCNIHPHMAAYVMAVDSPYYAVSDDKGEFVIPGLGAGTFTYHTWRPGAAIATATATISPERPWEIQCS